VWCEESRIYGGIDTNKEQLYIQLGRLGQALDKQIDTPVYGLYGLSEEEIKAVEGK
jgi:hypothetical protein